MLHLVPGQTAGGCEAQAAQGLAGGSPTGGWPQEQAIKDGGDHLAFRFALGQEGLDLVHQRPRETSAQHIRQSRQGLLGIGQALGLGI